MGRKSTKENKTRYQLAREAANMTRDDVDEATNGAVSRSRIEKIENGQLPQPYDVVELSKLYKSPDLCNYYCTNECEIGKKYVPKVETIHDLPQITLSILSRLNTLNSDKDRIIDIVSDGQITDDEKESFEEFKDHLLQMTEAVEALKLWAEKEAHIKL